MKVVYKFHLKCLQKVFRKFLFWCLGWFSLKSLVVLCAFWQLDYIKVFPYQLECSERGLMCNEARPNLSQLLRVSYFMWALKHAEQVGWMGIMVFWNRKEGLWLYHIFKLLILLFGFIMSWCLILQYFCWGLTQTTLVENIRLDAV